MAMARRGATRHPSLIGLVLLAGAASGTLLTLSNFEMLTSLTLPLNCIFAYNTPIQGCEISDFLGSSSSKCSERCKQGLEAVQFNVQASCASVDATSNTLLWKAQKGHVVDGLCKRNVPETSMASSTPSHPTSSVRISTKHEEAPAPTDKTEPPAKPVSTSFKPPPSTKESTPTSSSSQTSLEAASITVHTSDTSALPSTILTTSDSPTSNNTTSTSSPRQTDAEEESPTEMVEPPRQTVQPGSGGGSPFDFVSAGTLIKRRGKPVVIGITMAVAGLAFT